MQLLITLFVVFLSICLFPIVATAATPHLYDVPQAGPPGSQTQTVGNGWDPNATLDIYLDSTSVGLVDTDSNGSFGMALKAPTIRQNGFTIQIPKDAVPGQHWITAVERITQLQAQVPFTVGTDWPQFQVDAEHTGFNPYENVLNPSTVGSLTLRWTYALDNWLMASPTVADGVVYASTGSLFAIDASTGGLLWEHPKPPYYGGSPPAVLKGVVYVTTGGNWKAAWALSANTGDTIWHHGGFCGGVTTVVNGLEYVNGSDGYLYAVDTGTGAVVWKSWLIFAMSAPAAANGVVYVNAWDDNVYALDAGTGVLLWKFETPSPIASYPVVADGLVYVGARDLNIYALKADTGTVVWKYATGAAVDLAPAVANGVVYVLADKLYALDAHTGSLLWTKAAQAGTVPVVANGVVYFGTGADLYAVDASTGALLKAVTMNGIPYAPTVVNGMVYVGDGSGNLYAFGLPNQQMSEKFSPPERPDPARLTPNWSLQPSSQVTPPLKK